MNWLRLTDDAGPATGIPRLLDLRDNRQSAQLDGDLHVGPSDTRVVAHPEASTRATATANDLGTTADSSGRLPSNFFSRGEL